MQVARVIAIVVVLITLPASTRAADDFTVSLSPANAGFEGAVDLAHWTPRTLGAPANFAIDTNQFHDGKQSLRMEAKEQSRSAAISEPIMVAPGEVIHVSVWVKCKDVPADEGKIMLAGEWTDEQEHHPQAARIAIADVSNTEWQLLEGDCAIPSGAALMRIRIGFVYTRGTIWWDSLSVRTEHDVVIRISGSDRLTPADSIVRTTILNRSLRSRELRVRAIIGKQDSSEATLATKPGTNDVDVPVAVPKPASAAEVRVELLEGDKVIGSDQRKTKVPPAIAVPPVSPTHWAIEDGPPRFEGRVELAIATPLLLTASLDVRVADGHGKTVATQKLKNLHDGGNEFVVAADALPPGDYRLIATLTPGTGEPLYAEQTVAIIHRASASTTINERGFPVHNGKAIFPLGIFNGGAKVKELGAAGFTVQHAYNAVNVAPGDEPNDQAALDFLDNAQANGMTCLFLIPRGLAFAGDWDGVRRRIRMFRNHPALLAWDEEEGIARGDLSADGLQKLVSILREEDPHHPIMVGDSRDLIARMTDRSHFFPDEQMDLGMWWWYPFPLDQGKDAGLDGEERSKDLELALPSFLALAKVKQPLWVGVQAYKKPAEYGRYPTPAEYRAQAYLAIAGGAKGLMWYGGSVTGGAYGKPQESHWPELKSLATELHALEPVLIGETLAQPAMSPKETKLSALLKRSDDGRTILFVVNRAASAVNAAITLSESGATRASVIGEEREIAVRDRTLNDALAPYAVHVYELH